MTAVAIVTDSTHYLPRALADIQGIHQVSLYVGWEGVLERELEMGNFDRFYERLRADRELPSTSQPSIGDFLAVWEPLIEAGKDIASIHLGSGISGTWEVARQARGVLQERGLADRIEVIDGETGAGGLGCLLLAATACARSGADLKEVAARVHESRKVLSIRFCIDTLEYLQRGGRIGKAQAWLGSTLRIKPILTFEREVTPVERIVRTFEWDGMPGYVAIETATLEDLGDGRTKLVSVSLFHTTAERDGMLKSGMESGVQQSYAVLDKVLAAL